MTNTLRFRTVAAVLGAVIGQPVLAETLKVPQVPPAIQVPSGNVPYLKGAAVGTQNYVCRNTPTGVAWTLFGPQATVFITYRLFQTEIRQQIMTHFLSANPDEGGLPRPTWQSSLDTSAVWGEVAASSTDPAYVAPGAVAWLLLKVVGTEPGPAGGNSLKQTTFIQRVATSGGVAPAAGCTASTLGATVLVPYATDYYFYKAD
jgi:hypothetical protein